MNNSLLHGEDGQALVIVGLAMVVLMGALALSVDWGYGLAMRRAAQNQADTAALAAGRYLASTYVSPTRGFQLKSNSVSQGAVWCEAKRARDANTGSVATAATPSLRVTFRAADGSELAAVSSGNCSATSSGSDVPPATVQIQVRAAATYGSLLGIATPREILVAASAGAQLTGAPLVRQLTLPKLAAERPGIGLSGYATQPNVALWPIVRHISAGDFTRTPCGGPCAADGGGPVTFWPASASGDDGQRFGAFTGLVSYSNSSIYEASLTHQIVTESDYTGSIGADQMHVPPTAPVTNHGEASCGTRWDTNGSRTLSGAIACDLPNWFYYGFRGSLAIGTDWSDPSWNVFLSDGPVERPDPLPTDLVLRASCGAPAYFPTPSCIGTGSPGRSSRGDWVETVSGTPTPAMLGAMHAFISRYGREVRGASGLGKAVVVNVFLWDCAEQFTGTSGNRWQLVLPKAGDETMDGPDCSQIRPKDPRMTPINRVHLLTAVPFTFYDTLIGLDSGGNASVQAYWGDAFGDAGVCQSIPLPTTAECQLNPLMNSAFLVPDE